MTTSAIFIRELSAACRLHTAHSAGVREMSVLCARTGLSASEVNSWARLLSLVIDRPSWRRRYKFFPISKRSHYL